MKILEYLVDHMEEEQDYAIKYLEKAAALKDEYPRLSDALVEIARQEAQHASIMREHAAKIIEQAKTDGQRNVGMEWAWGREIERYIARDIRIRMLMDAQK